MAVQFRFIVPGTQTIATYGSGRYPSRPTKVVGDQTVNQSIQEDIFNYLYPYEVMANSVADKQRMAAESNFKKITDDRASVIFKSDVVVTAIDAQTGRETTAASEDYARRLAEYNQDCFNKTVTVYQRFWAATHADSEKPLIATMGIVLCVFVIIFDPATGVAAAAHLDKDQRSEDIASIVPGVFPGNKPLEVYIIGGQPSSRGMEEATRRNIQGQLKGLYECSSRQNRQITIRMFEVLGRMHPSEMTFDTRNGAMMPFYNGVPPAPQPVANGPPAQSTVMGQPLDTVCRYWPNGQYLVSADSSGLAQAGNDLRTAVPPNAQLADDLTIMRCQWDGTPTGWPAFYAASNERICHLTVQFAFAFVNTDPGSLENVDTELKTILKGLNKPMMLEQSLKAWVRWTNVWNGLEKPEPIPKQKALERGEKSLTSHLVRILKSNEGVPNRARILASFNELLPAWDAKGDFAVAWEGRH